MKVFDNHFEGKPTILIDNRIINGCQNFTIEESKEVFNRFNVHPSKRRDVLNAYTGVSSEAEVMQYVDHPSLTVRKLIARHGYALEQLKGDPSWRVRREVARHGYALEQYKDDSAWMVRREVASQGYALEQLKDDVDASVRCEVSKQGYALEQFKDDPNWKVRFAVASQGYAVEQLKCDKEKAVSVAAIGWIESHQ